MLTGSDHKSVVLFINGDVIVESLAQFTFTPSMKRSIPRDSNTPKINYGFS
jgi:hypothetical protein